MAAWGRWWTIYWSEYATDTYLYGTEIVFHAQDDVEMRNLLMPPGTVIKSWHSRTNFQRDRIEPTLPIIDGEGYYRISADMECDVEGGILVRLLFLDKNGAEVSILFMDGPTMEFRCPFAAYSYEVQLICAGAHALRFRSLMIEERTRS